MLRLSPAAPEVGFIHRKLPDADIYFIANTGNRPQALAANFRAKRIAAERWDPFTGKTAVLEPGSQLNLNLAPYQSEVVVFTDRAATPAPAPDAKPFVAIDLSHDWKVTFDKTSATVAMPTLHSWADDEAEKYYSGTATYERTVEIPDEVAKAGVVYLDFGEGTPVEREPQHQPGMRTWLDAPLRDAAVVFVNGKPAGTVWHPPFRLDVAPLVHAGTNTLKIVVANTAINELAGRARAGLPAAEPALRSEVHAAGHGSSGRRCPREFWDRCGWSRSRRRS